MQGRFARLRFGASRNFLVHRCPLPWLTSIALAFFFFAPALVVRAQPSAFTMFTNFTGPDGAYPETGLTQGSDGNLYGTTYLGGSNLIGPPTTGTNSYGTVFKMTTNGALLWQVSFTDTNGSFLGAYPDGALRLGPDGNFYGTTLLGGSNGSGSIFKVTTNGTFSPVYSFDALPGTRSIAAINTDTAATNDTGGEPIGALTLGPDGRFYGTTIYGGSNGVGTVFRVTTNGILSTLVTFGPATNITSTNTAGSRPIVGLTLGTDGVFYGTTAYGGSNGQGTVFKLTTNGAFTSLVSFDALVTNGPVATNATGVTPAGTLTERADHNFYGINISGGTHGVGTIFKVTPSGTLTPLFSFDQLVSNGHVGTNASGAKPHGGLTVGSDGNLYGTTVNGGLGGGTVFTYTTNGAFIPFFDFGPVSVGNGPNSTGAQPAELTLGVGGNFYGTCFNGGSTDYGTVFEIVAATLNIRWLSGKVVVTWPNPAFGLQSSPSATGTFTDLTNATSPYTNTNAAPQLFFRLSGN